MEFGQVTGRQVSGRFEDGYCVAPLSDRCVSGLLATWFCMFCEWQIGHRTAKLINHLDMSETQRRACDVQMRCPEPFKDAEAPTGWNSLKCLNLSCLFPSCKLEQ